MSVRMKRENGMLVSSKEEVKGVWKRHCECLMMKGQEGTIVDASSLRVKAFPGGSKYKVGVTDSNKDG